MANEQEQYSLALSTKRVGKLVPILKDARGNVIDGKHRQDVDANWPSITLANITDDLELTLARLIANACRREVERPEKNELLGKIKKLKPEWTIPDIAEALGMSEAWVYEYLPEEFKNQQRSKEIKEGIASHKTNVDGVDIPESTKEVLAKVAPCDICGATSSTNVRHGKLNVCPICLGKIQQPLVECSNCRMGKHPNEIKEVDGKPYCLKCAPFVKARPAENIPNGVRLEKPTESWAYRKAVMTPQHSKMEEAILQKLDEAGIRPVVTDRSFCLASTTPDFYFPTLNLAVYLDGPVHEGKEDRDEELTDLLEKRHQVRVCRIKYSGVTDKEQTRILQEIKERVKA